MKEFYEDEQTSMFPEENTSFKRLTDNDLMPSGIHEGTKMKDVPAYYLIWCADNNKCSKPVRAYITDNRERLERDKAKSEPKHRVSTVPGLDPYINKKGQGKFNSPPTPRKKY